MSEKTWWRGTFNSLGKPVIEKCPSYAGSMVKAETFEGAKEAFRKHFQTLADEKREVQPSIARLFARYAEEVGTIQPEEAP